jgi:hypothetical protein
LASGIGLAVSGTRIFSQLIQRENCHGGFAKQAWQSASGQTAAVIFVVQVEVEGERDTTVPKRKLYHEHAGSG